MAATYPQILGEDRKGIFRIAHHLCLPHSAGESIQEEAILAGGSLQVFLNQLHHHLIAHLTTGEGGEEKGKVSIRETATSLSEPPRGTHPANEHNG